MSASSSSSITGKRHVREETEADVANLTPSALAKRYTHDENGCIDFQKSVYWKLCKKELDKLPEIIPMHLMHALFPVEPVSRATEYTRDTLAKAMLLQFSGGYGSRSNILNRLQDAVMQNSRYTQRQITLDRSHHQRKVMKEQAQHFAAMRCRYPLLAPDFNSVITTGLTEEAHCVVFVIHGDLFRNCNSLVCYETEATITEHHSYDQDGHVYRQLLDLGNFSVAVPDVIPATRRTMSKPWRKVRESLLCIFRPWSNSRLSLLPLELREELLPYLLDMSVLCMSIEHVRSLCQLLLHLVNDT